MKLSDFLSLVSTHDIPKDALVLSDSGWEHGFTFVNGVYYNADRNLLVLTQGEDYEKASYYENNASFRYSPRNGWKLLS